MSVISESNKQILWEVLNGMIDENKLEIQNVNQFRQFFENECSTYHSKRFDYDGLSDINKLIVSSCFQYLTKLSQDTKLIMFRDYEKFGNKNLVKSLQVGKRYEEHESNFKKLMNNNKPGEIDFSENTDEPIGNMDNVLSNTMEQRESELSNIRKTYDTNDSIKWLNSGGVPKLKIHDEIPKINLIVEEKSAKQKKPKKKVKFKNDVDAMGANAMGAMGANGMGANAMGANAMGANGGANAMDANAMDKYFNIMNDDMNNNIKEKEMDIKLKMDLIKEVESREKKEGEEKKHDVNLNNFFESMKVKTKDSDVNAAKSQTDIINISRRLDKLETYLFDILNNQIKILEKLS